MENRGGGPCIRSITRAAAVSDMTLYTSTIHVMFAGRQIDPALVVSICLQTSVLWAQQDETVHRGRLSLPAVHSYPKRGPGQRGIGACKSFHSVRVRLMIQREQPWICKACFLHFLCYIRSEQAMWFWGIPAAPSSSSFLPTCQRHSWLRRMASRTLCN